LCGPRAAFSVGAFPNVRAVVKHEQSERAEGGDEARHHVRLPRFLVDEPVGLGSTIKRATTTLGVSPCGPCEERASRLDRWVRLEPRR
jgi:hypothetical protein